MQDSGVLKHKLEAIDRRDYGAYQALKGEYAFPGFSLSVDQIPKDPYAPPHTGVYLVLLKNGFTSPAGRIFASNTSLIAFRDFLARAFYVASLPKAQNRRGTGYSGIITIAEPGQVILERNSVLADRDRIEARFFAGLPADGRRINARLCSVMLLQELPAIVEQALFAEHADLSALERHINTAEDCEHLRSALRELDLTAFIADNSILPRASGSSDLPLEREKAVPFKSPPSLAMETKLPHAGKIRGMGIPKGITLIAGGGYHGKSTLLKAVQSGIYNHIPGDGRELCAAHPAAVKIRAYSGRYVEKTDISPFISNLPLRKDTTRFSTENASGSTSQAAGITEAIEAGAKLLLMDEDTCATNFMIRDMKMRRLVPKEDEPITAFIDKVEDLYRQQGISSVLVLGGSGDYFGISHTVIQMKNYEPLDVTQKAHDIAGGYAQKIRPESDGAAQKRQPANGADVQKQHTGDDGRPPTLKPRIPVKGCITPYNDYNKISVYATETNRIRFGRTVIDLTDCEQLVELSQTKAIAEALIYLARLADGKRSLTDIVNKVTVEIETHGLDVVSRRLTGQFAAFRGMELAFAINRSRDLKIV
jgi:predicted ABC-class ATPase